MKKKLLLLLAACLCAGCGEEPAKDEPPPLVRALVIGKETISSDREYTGRVVSRYETPLSFQVSGEINGRYVNQGSVVKAGDTLMTINPRDTSANVEAATADVIAKRAEAELAAVNLKRYRELFTADAVPKAQLDEAQARADATKAALEAAEANLTKATNSNNYTNLKAPIDGVVTSITGEIGQIASPGSPMLTLADENSLEVETDLPEAEYSSVKEGANAWVKFYGIEGKFPAIVREITPYANAASRTYRLRLSLSSVPQDLALGRTASISFNKKNVTSVIPLSAIDGEGENTFCWVIENNRVHKQPVKVSIANDNAASAELPEGTVIVTAGVHLLKDDMEVRRDDDVK